MLNTLICILKKQLPVRLFNEIQKNYDTNHQFCSIFLRYDNNKILSQFTVWDDLSIMQEIFDMRTDKYIKYNRLELVTVDEVQRAFDEFLTIISSL